MLLFTEMVSMDGWVSNILEKPLVPLNENS